MSYDARNPKFINGFPVSHSMLAGNVKEDSPKNTSGNPPLTPTPNRLAVTADGGRYGSGSSAGGSGRRKNFSKM